MWQLWLCYSLLSDTMVRTEECSMLQGWGYISLCSCLGCWHNGFKQPILKHGPRSLTCLQVFGWKTHVHNESESWDPCHGEHQRLDQNFLGWICGRACMLGPERWWNYAWIGWSQRKLWWRLVVIVQECGQTLGLGLVDKNRTVGNY